MAINIKLTKKQQQYLAIGAVLVGALGFTYIKYFWMPISKQIAELQGKIEEVTAKIEKAKVQAARLPRIEAELVLLNQQAADAERRLPRIKSVPDILVTLTSLAHKHNVEVLTFAPGGQQAREFFYEHSYPVTVNGSFHNVGRFLAAISLEERIFNVKNINYGGASGPRGELSISFTLVSYQYKG